jgi:hypothetical protein
MAALAFKSAASAVSAKAASTQRRSCVVVRAQAKTEAADVVRDRQHQSSVVLDPGHMHAF